MQRNMMFMITKMYLSVLAW